MGATGYKMPWYSCAHIILPVMLDYEQQGTCTIKCNNIDTTLYTPRFSDRQVKHAQNTTGSMHCAIKQVCAIYIYGT